MAWAWAGLALLVLIAGGLSAQEPPTAAKPKPGEPGLAEQFEDWIAENVDEDVLEALGVDTARVREVTTALLRKLEATDVYELGSLRDAVREILPVLRQFEETEPYAAWLERQFDYIVVSRELKKEAESGPPKRGAPRPLPAPTPQAQRKAWDTWLAGRPASPSAEAWVRKLKPVFREEGVPAELVWLAEVESSFNAGAKSPKGAAGLYQLMPATARSLGLSTWPFDDRLAGEENARAAARYLRYLYGRFGDWRLALAAYNSGEGRVGRMLEAARERTFAAIAPRLPAETQMYVPRFEATLRRREGVALTAIGAPRPPRAGVRPTE